MTTEPDALRLTTRSLGIAAFFVLSSVFGGATGDGREGGGPPEARSYLTHDLDLSSTLWQTLSSTSPSGLAVTLRDAPLRPRFSQEQALLELQFTGDTTHGLRLALEGAQRRLRLRSTDVDTRRGIVNGSSSTPPTSSAVDVDGVPREVVLLFSTSEGQRDPMPNTDVHVFLDCQVQEQLSLSLPLKEMARQSTGLRVYRDKRIKVDTVRDVTVDNVLRRASTSCSRREALTTPSATAHNTRSGSGRMAMTSEGVVHSDEASGDVHFRGDLGRLATRALIDLIDMLSVSTD